jgi:hypothetical protein
MREGNQICPSEASAQGRHEPEFERLESHQIESLKLWIVLMLMITL